MDKVIKALLNTKRSAEASSSAERLQKVDIQVQGAMLRINGCHCHYENEERGIGWENLREGKKMMAGWSWYVFFLIFHKFFLIIFVYF